MLFFYNSNPAERAVLNQAWKEIHDNFGFA